MRRPPTTEPDAATWRRPALGLCVLLAAGLAGAAVGCGPAGFRTCDVDSDCRNDEICARPDGTQSGRCAKRCERDEDCERAGTTCQPYIDPDRDQEEEICLAADTGPEPETGDRCNSDEDCEDFDAGPAVCGINGRCILVDPRHAVRIVDRSPTGESGGDGAEIAAVYLDNREGYGDTIRWCPGGTGGGTGSGDTGVGDTGTSDTGTTDTGLSDAGDAGAGPTDTGGTDTSSNDTTATDTSSEDTGSPSACRTESTIDGSQPALDADETCIDGSKSQTTALGEGGELYVEFVDGNGSSVEIEASNRIAVIEWGQNCDSRDSEADRYDVEFCTTVDDSFHRSDCETLEANVAGGKVVVDPSSAL